MLLSADENILKETSETSEIANRYIHEIQCTFVHIKFTIYSIHII